MDTPISPPRLLLLMQRAAGWASIVSSNEAVCRAWGSCVRAAYRPTGLWALDQVLLLTCLFMTTPAAIVICSIVRVAQFATRCPGLSHCPLPCIVSVEAAAARVTVILPQALGSLRWPDDLEQSFLYGASSLGTALDDDFFARCTA